MHVRARRASHVMYRYTRVRAVGFNFLAQDDKPGRDLWREVLRTEVKLFTSEYNTLMYGGTALSQVRACMHACGSLLACVLLRLGLRAGWWAVPGTYMYVSGKPGERGRAHSSPCGHGGPNPGPLRFGPSVWSPMLDQQGLAPAPPFHDWPRLCIAAGPRPPGPGRHGNEASKQAVH